MGRGGNKNKGVLLPPAVGYSFRILLTFMMRYHISPRYYFRLLVLGLINLINWPFRTYERLIINPRIQNKRIENDPVFILGHWRSGTTHLHNLLSLDPQMGYITTYQGVFPDTLFNRAGRFLFKNFTRVLIPGTRKGDNVTLHPDFPQEEEFALGDKTQACYYYFWMFPRHIPEFYDRYIRFNQMDEKSRREWRNDYRLLIRKGLKNTGGQRFLSKNPPNTGRLNQLLEIFPNARFIFIHRNPVEVFLSTRHFYATMMPHLQMQSIDEGTLNRHIIHIYKNLMNDYLEQKKLVPPGNLFEVRFEDLENQPLEVLEALYGKLRIPGFDKAKTQFEQYLEKMQGYRKNIHSIHRDELDVILREWSFAMEKYEYGVPDTIRITD